MAGTPSLERLAGSKARDAPFFFFRRRNSVSVMAQRRSRSPRKQSSSPVSSGPDSGNSPRCSAERTLSVKPGASRPQKRFMLHSPKPPLGSRGRARRATSRSSSSSGPSSLDSPTTKPAATTRCARRTGSSLRSAPRRAPTRSRGRSACERRSRLSFADVDEGHTAPCLRSDLSPTRGASQAPIDDSVSLPAGCTS
jgi:hypothetical protein